MEGFQKYGNTNTSRRHVHGENTRWIGRMSFGRPRRT
jgi:hypothetical protein